MMVQRIESGKMNRWTCLLAASILVASGGCATVVSEKRYPVTIDNVPGPTYYSVFDRKNQVVHQGVTPEQLTLDAKSLPFWPAKYSVVFAGTQSASQRQDIQAGFDPWIAGNILIGGGLGAIVDGATGAMFKLPPRVTGNVAEQYVMTDPTVGAQIVAASVSQSHLMTDGVKPISPYSPIVSDQSTAPVMPVSAISNQQSVPETVAR